MGSPATAHVTVLAFRTALVERALPGVDGCADRLSSWLSRPEPQAREVGPGRRCRSTSIALVAPDSGAEMQCSAEADDGTAALTCTAFTASSAPLSASVGAPQVCGLVVRTACTECHATV